jgi:Clathrin adaptor complex small chain
MGKAPTQAMWDDLGALAVQIHFFMLINKQGKVRLSKWYSTYSQKQRARTLKEVSSIVLARGPQVCRGQ